LDPELVVRQAQPAGDSARSDAFGINELKQSKLALDEIRPVSKIHHLPICTTIAAIHATP
jgi:hypothetical protein